MSCIEKDDSAYYGKYLAYPVLLAVYTFALALSLRKLGKAVIAMNKLCICIFLINTIFFSARCAFWLDFAFDYPTVAYNFLDYWPHILICTACITLGTSWMLICFNFEVLFQGNFKWITRSAIGTGVTVNIAFIACYFALYESLGCKTAGMYARGSIAALIIISISYLGYFGLKFIKLVHSNLSDTSTTKVKQMLSYALVCCLFRATFNIFFIFKQDYLITLNDKEDGAYFAVFLIVDYFLSEVLLMYGITHTITAQPRHMDSYVDCSLNITTMKDVQ
mmetsp:Transcript_13375/g.25164  ORF Transcript_13375/g.25164 Transcript_13375/m.25164 type:complete len:278 (-) Transcript_13375:29-862(-)